MKKKRSLHIMTGSLLAYILLSSGCKQIDVGKEPYSLEPNKEFLYQVSKELPGFAEGDSEGSITQSLLLPTEYEGVKIRWNSSDESLLETDGTIHRPHDASKDVVLSGEYTNGEDVTNKSYVLHIERDMYADKTYKDIFPLEYYDDHFYYEKNQVDLSDVDGWCYLIDNWDQLHFFEESLDNLTLNLVDDPVYDSFIAYGTFCDMRIESRHESDLLLYAMKNLIKADISKGDLQFQGCMNDSAFIRYDYQQYYQGVKVNPGSVSLTINYEDTNKSMSSCILPIPDGFDVTPKITAEEIKSKADTNKEPELIIDQVDEKVHLIWKYVEAKKQEIVYIDAKDGTELKRYSYIVT